MQNPALDELRKLRLMETRVEHFAKALESGRVGVNICLRRLHAFAVDTGWLPWPVMSKKRWPKIVSGEKRGITAEEHHRIIAAERDEEVRDFYELLWQVGGSQSDMAALTAENIDWDMERPLNSQAAGQLGQRRRKVFQEAGQIARLPR